MCGILGSVNVPFGHEVLDLIAHRGPDDFGLEQFHLQDHHVILGHRRLSIVDLSMAGHQPMTSNCGNFVIIFNGEIYNHQDLRSKLFDIAFRGHSDTETIVNYIARFGIDAVKDFNGIFAFAILDKKNGTIHLARDRYGVKPLYYYRSDRKLVFASELKPVHKLVSSKLDVQNLALLLRLRYSPSPYTLFDNIHKLRPGHIAEFNIEKGVFTTFSYIKAVKLDKSISFDEAVEQYGMYFESAVKRQLMSDVDIGMLLSGGLDSALVGNFATKHYPGKLKTFTVGFDDLSEANEITEARETAKLLETDHHEVLISAEQFDESFRKLVITIEEPLGTTSTIPLFHLNGLVAKHVKVVLSGQGADEPLGGYARYQGELFRKALSPFAWRLGSKYGRKFLQTKEKFQRALYSLGEDDVIRRFDKTYALFTYEEINGLVDCKSTKALDVIGYYYNLLGGSHREPVEALMSNDLRMNLSDDLLLLADKISMHFSIEGRVPLLDNELVDFVESLPYHYRLAIGKGKLVHKKFAEKCLPGELIHRKKKGFWTPTEGWFRNAIGRKYYEILSEPNSKFSNYFDRRAVQKIFDQHQTGINREKQIFTLISIYYWMDEFL